MSTLSLHASNKTKYSSDLQSSGKSASGPSIRPETCEVVVDAPHHGIGKGLMTSQGPVATPLPLLVKDKKYAVDTTHSIVWDANLDKCSEYETDLLGDFGLYDMVRVCCISISFDHSSSTFVPFDSLFYLSLLTYVCPF